MMKNNYIKNFLTIGLGTAISMIIGFLTTPIITRIVGTTTYGQYSIFIMYVNIGVMILCMGLDQGIMRFYFKDDSLEYKKLLIRACCIIPIIATILITFLVLILSYSNIIKFEFNTKIILLLGFCILLQIIYRLNMVQLRVAYKTKNYATLNIIQRIIYVVLTVLMIVTIKTSHFQSLVIATIISYFIVVIIGIYYQRNEWKFWNINYDKKFDYKELYKYSLPFIISMGITTIFQAIDKISLKFYCDYSEVGIYSSALNIIHIFSIVQTTFNALWSPMANEHHQKDPNDTEFYKKGNRIITVIMFIIGITLILFRNIIVLLLGNSYREAANILPFLIFNPIMYTISETTISGLTFKKKSNMHILIAAIACICNIIGNIILIPKIGSKGAAISTGISYIIFFTARTIIANKYYRINWDYKKIYTTILITAIYALYNTFYSNSIIIITSYIIIICIIIMLYKDTIKEVVNYLKKDNIKIKRRRKK